MIYGTAGRFIIPEVGVSVPLYTTTNKSGQDIVDREDSARLCLKFNGGCDYVADHSAQGFDKIRRCRLSDAAYIQTATSTQVYICTALTIEGQNVGTDIITASGARVSKCTWADLCAYCCNDATGKSVTMVFFKKWMKLDYPYFRDDPVEPDELENPVEDVATIHYVEVNDGCTCNVRSEPSTNGKILGTIRHGEKLQLIDEIETNGWYPVRYKNQNAWISAKYTSLE